MSGHEDTAAEMHHEAEEHRDSKIITDMAGGEIKKADYSPNGGKSPDTELGDTPEGEEPNDREKATLRRVGENLPASAFLIAIVELCERFTYYGCQGLFQNCKWAGLLIAVLACDKFMQEIDSLQMFQTQRMAAMVLWALV